MTVRLHPSSYLSIPRFSLIEALVESLPRHEVDDWTTFAKSMSYVVNGAYGGVLEAMRAYAWEESTGKLHTEEDSREALFKYLTRMLSLISAAQYTPMTDQHWMFGVVAQNYTSGQSVEVDMSKHEEMFHGYFHKHPYWFGSGSEANEGLPAPDFSSRVLLFFRGTTEITYEGLHIQGKIKYLVRFWLSVLGAVARLLRLPFAKHARMRDFQSELADDDTGVQSRFGPKKLERVTLESYIKKHGIFRSLFRSITLIEPAYSSVLVVYPCPRRKKFPQKVEKKEKEVQADLIGKAAETAALGGLGKMKKAREGVLKKGIAITRKSLQGHLETLRSEFEKEKGEGGGGGGGGTQGRRSMEDPNRDNTELSSVISIESYDKVPFRDLGLLIPGRSVRLGLFQKVKFAVELSVCLLLVVSCLLSLEYPNTVRGFIIVFFLFATVVKALGVVQNVSELKTQINAGLNDWLDQRLVGKGNAFVSSLVNQVQEQELKEILLGYFFLWKKSPLTQRQLDYEVETFLNDQFQLELDFEVEDALQKLISLKLIEEVGGKFRCARRPKDYLDDPDPRWLEFYHSFGEQTENESSVHMPVHTETPRPPPQSYSHAAYRKDRDKHPMRSAGGGGGGGLDTSFTHLSETYSTLHRTTSLGNSLAVPNPRRRH